MDVAPSLAPGAADRAGPVLRARDLSVTYGNVRALEPVSFHLDSGAMVLVVGPNGAGKSTLLRGLAGVVRPRTGRVELEGGDVTWVPVFRRVRRGVALVPEGRGPLPGLSVRDNLDLGWHAAGRDRRSPKDEGLARIIELFPILGKRLDQDCSTLSGGEMQMLAIGRALLSEPKVLLLDEPSLGLAPQAVSRVYQALSKLNADGLSMVVVEQKAVPLDRIPDLTIVLQSGRVIYQEANARPSDDELAAIYLGGTLT